MAAISPGSDGALLSSILLIWTGSCDQQRETIALKGYFSVALLTSQIEAETKVKLKKVKKTTVLVKERCQVQLRDNDTRTKPRDSRKTYSSKIIHYI